MIGTSSAPGSFERPGYGRAVANLLALMGAGTALFYNGQDLVFYVTAGGLVLAALAVVLASSRTTDELKLGAAGVMVALLVGWSLLAVSWSEITYLTILDIGHVGAALATYLVARSLFEHRRAALMTAAAFTAGGCVLAATMIVQFLQGTQPTGAFLNPNTAAAYINMLWPLPAAVSLHPGLARYRWPLLGAMAFLLTAALVGGSRAAMLAAVAGLGVFVLATKWAPWNWRRALTLVAVFAGTVALVQIVSATGLGTPGESLAGRFASLGSPAEAGSTRWPIWQATWAMIQQRPLLGFGPGTFFQVYPAWRLPDDVSAGYFAHNDYLQFFAERGLPGLLLLLALGGIGIRYFCRGLNRRRPPGDRVTTVAMTAALAAAAVHALFSFPLHLLPFMYLLGFTLAALEVGSGASPSLRIPLRRVRSRPLVAVAVAGLLLIPATYLGSIAATDYYTRSAGEHIEAGQFDAAEADFATARRLWATYDPAWVINANMLEGLLARMPTSKTPARDKARSAALELIEEARRKNPWRALTPTTLGGIYLEPPNADPAAAQAAFRSALQLNPRYTPARVGLTRTMRQDEGVPAARKVIEQGLDQYSRRNPPLRLMRLGVELRKADGDEQGAQELARTIEQALEKNREPKARRRPTPTDEPQAVDAS